MGSQAHEILVVDDDADACEAMCALLLRADYRVRTAHGGAACLAAVEAVAPSLVLLDVSMPGMDGFETLSRLRVAAGRDLPVVLVTGHRFDPDSIGSGLELGAEEYLSKPIRPAELLARVRALLRLSEARKELAALKRDQTAMLVHDLKQPLAIIALRADFVADEARDKELVRSARVIREACRQMDGLVRSMLELSRVEAGQLRLTCSSVALVDLTNEVVSSMYDLAARRGLDLRVRCTPECQGALPFVDRQKITQVLQNLLANAMQFTASGGTIEVQLEAAGENWLVAVEDTGCGLSADEAARVFDKWHQTQIGRARGGSGLGLAIARAVIEAHRGEIKAGARRDGNRGARFWFILPATPSLLYSEAAAR